MSPPLKLKVDGLAVERGGRTVISGLSFEVAAGEALLVTGPNGAGKTTLLRTISGFIGPRDGSITLDGGESDAPVAEQSHIVGHLNGIKSALTVAENLAFMARFLDAQAGGWAAQSEIDAKVAAAMGRMGLSGLSDIPSGFLSAGQKRRLCLARLLVADRPLWLLDEPTVSLDTASTALVAGLIDAHVASGGIAVIVTHVPLGLQTSRELVIVRPSAEAA